MKLLFFAIGCIIGSVAAYYVIEWQIGNTIDKAVPVACSELTWMINDPQEQCK